MKVLLSPPSSPKYYFFSFLQVTYTSVTSKNTIILLINTPFLSSPNTSSRFNKVKERTARETDFPLTPPVFSGHPPNPFPLHLHGTCLGSPAGTPRAPPIRQDPHARRPASELPGRPTPRPGTQNLGRGTDLRTASRPGQPRRQLRCRVSLTPRPRPRPAGAGFQFADEPPAARRTHHVQSSPRLISSLPRSRGISEAPSAQFQVTLANSLK